MRINPDKIRSAQFNDTYFPVIDGVVRVVHNYAEIMNRQSYTCVVAPEPLKKGFDDSRLSYDVYRTSSVKMPVAEYSISAPKFDRNVKDYLRQKDIDIFHAHSPFFEGTFASSFARQLGVPCVATFHSKYYDDVLNITGSKALAKIVTRKIVRFYNGVDSVWTVSKGAAETLRDYGYRGDITIMENGTAFTPPADPAAAKERARSEFSIPQDKRIILFVGHLIKHKNLKLILDTFRMLNDHSDKYRLIVVGDGYDEVDIKEYARSLNFSDGYVRFLGKITDRSLLAGVYLNADLFFFPSVYDTSGLVIREAAVMGVPSLLTEGSCAAGAIKNNVTGFVAAENRVAMYHKILHIFSTEGLLEKAGAGAKATLSNTWTDLMPQVREKYAEVIERYNYKKLRAKK